VLISGRTWRRRRNERKQNRATAKMWANLLSAGTCEELTRGVRDADLDNRSTTSLIPAAVVNALVAAAHARPPQYLGLLWALATHPRNLGAALTETDLAELARVPLTHSDAYSRARGGTLLRRYDKRIDETSKVAMLTAAGPLDVRQWCVDGSLTVADAGAVRAWLASHVGDGPAADVAWLLNTDQVRGLEWVQVAENPLLLDLMLSSPDYVALLASEVEYPLWSLHGHPKWGPALRGRFQASVRDALGKDERLLACFCALLDNTGGASTGELLDAVQALNAPQLAATGS